MEYYRAGIGKIWPMGQIQLAAYFCKQSLTGIQADSLIYILSMADFPIQQSN